MTNNFTSRSVIDSLFWKLLERGGTQGVQLIIQIILARLLEPQQFGTIAIVLVFINFAQVFVQGGFNSALIQTKEADDEDFSSVFYFSLFLSVITYLVIYFCSPLIASFYGNYELTLILRIISIILFPMALSSIQNAYISRNMLFRKLFKSSLISVILSGLLGVYLAYKGMGIWSLVFQQIMTQVSISVILWFTINWRPKLIFSIKSLQKLFRFGSNIFLSSILNVIYIEIRTLVIGRVYSASTLGFYNRGEQFPKLIVSNLNGSIQSVMLPVLSFHQDDKLVVKKMMRRSIVTSSFFVFPLMIGLLVVAESFITILLTEKWLPAAPFLRIFCLIFALMPIHTANLQAINAIGRSDIFFKLEIIKKIIEMVILIISVRFGVFAIALGQLLSGIIATFINAYPNRIYLEYTYLEQIKDIVPSFMISIIMGIVVYFVGKLEIPLFVLLSFQILIGFIVYFVIAWMLKIEAFNYLLNMLHKILKSRKTI